MKEMNDNIRSIKIKLGQAADEWAVIIHMYVWLKTGKLLKAKYLMHKSGIEHMFVTTINLMFDEIRRKYYGSQKHPSSSAIADLKAFESLCKKDGVALSSKKKKKR